MHNPAPMIDEPQTCFLLNDYLDNKLPEVIHMDSL